MKKVKSFGLFALVGLLVVGFCACSGSSNDSVTLKVESQLNSLSEYLTVDDKEVVVSLANETKDGKEYKAILSSLALTVKQSVASNYGFDFEVVVLDKNHIEITELPNYKIDDLYDYDNEDLNYYLSSGFVRAQMKHGIEEWTVDDQKLWEKIREEGAYIQIKPNWSSAKFAPYKGGKSSTVNSEGSDEDTYSSSNSTTEDWDALLDSYEEYVESYISLLKKANAGDLDALSEYPSFLQKAQEMGEKMSNASGDLSVSQLNRYNQINQKMLNAAQEMK